MILQSTASHADELISEQVGEPYRSIPGQPMLSRHHDNEAVDREGPHDQITRLDRAGQYADLSKTCA
ncbi:MAG: hypothetical protein ABF665_19985, partial [Gluconacetobacter sp.]